MGEKGPDQRGDCLSTTLLEPRSSTPACRSMTNTHHPKPKSVLISYSASGVDSCRVRTASFFR